MARKKRTQSHFEDQGLTRRQLLGLGMHGVGVSAALPLLLHRTSAAMAFEKGAGESASEGLGDKIMVVVELSGGNDGLNTVIPYRDDAYYRVRPTLGIKKDKLIPVSDEFGFHPSLSGLEHLFKKGQLAIVHGCGYDNPSLSHFESMGFWHTGVPNAGEPLGWMGRFADLAVPNQANDLIVNIGSSQSPAVRSGIHTPVVFNDPNRFRWEGTDAQKHTYETLNDQGRHTTNPSLDFLHRVAKNAVTSSKFVREACSGYQTSVDYGIRAGLGGDLIRVAALIEAQMPSNLYYVAASGNTFDTHVHQEDLHARLLMYTADALRGFMEDMERIGRAKDVAVLVFTEFGRRVEENASLGTDHGTATPLFVIGQNIKGGFHGKHPSLTDLDDGNLIKTTDFRQVYASMVQEWMGYSGSSELLKGDFEPLGLFGTQA